MVEVIIVTGEGRANAMRHTVSSVVGRGSPDLVFRDVLGTTEEEVTGKDQVAV